MAVTFQFPPFPESEVDHYNVYLSDGADPPVFSLIGTVAQGVTALLTFTDAGSPTSADTFYVAAADASDNELVRTPNFIPDNLSNVVRLFGRVLNTAAQPLPKVPVDVVLSIPAATRYGTIIERAAKVYTDEDGYWFFDLYPNEDLIPADTTYWIQLDNSQGGPPVDIVVPQGAAFVYYPSLVSYL